MTRLLYAVSPIGLGHASRAAAVGLKLDGEGLKAEFATGGKAVAFLRSYGFTVHDIVSEPLPSESDGVMRYPALWYLRYWMGYRSTKTEMTELVGRLKPEVIIGDEEFSSVSIALERGIRHTLISDELELGFARTALAKYIEKKVSKWYTALQGSVSSILVPDYGSDYGNVHFVSPVVRDVTSDRETVLKSIGIDPESRMILLSASGSGIGDFLLRSTIAALERLRIPDANLVVTGLEKGGGPPNVRYLGTYRDNQNLVAGADLVISTAGKSTIDEALSHGSPIITIPIKNHVEQERNAAALGFSHKDIYRLKDLIAEYLGRRSTPKNYRGAEAVAEHIRKIT